MNAVVLLVFGAFALQSSFAQAILPGALVATAPIIQSNNVGTTLADTLSLLTVSSLLSEKLPFDYPYGYAPYVPPCESYGLYAPYVPPCEPYVPPYGPYAPYAPYAPFAPAYAPYDIVAPYAPAYAPYDVVAPYGPYEIIGPAPCAPCAPFEIVNNCGCGGFGYPYVL